MNKTPTQRKQCVAIAKDVLVQLRLELLTPIKSVYCRLSDRITGDLRSGLKLAQTKPKPCQACGIGAMFIAAVRLYDKYSCDNEQFPSEENIRAALRGYFTNAEIQWIESAFEGWEGYWDFLCKVPKTEDRLIAICRNIIRNKGDFDGEPLAKEATLPLIRKATLK